MFNTKPSCGKHKRNRLHQKPGIKTLIQKQEKEKGKKILRKIE